MKVHTGDNDPAFTKKGITVSIIHLFVHVVGMPILNRFISRPRFKRDSRSFTVTE